MRIIVILLNNTPLMHFCNFVFTMMKTNRSLLLVGGMSAAILFSFCARQSAPTGGPEDTTPPEVLPRLSTANYSTRFDKKKIELVFNEWVVLSDVGTQVLISPPLQVKKVPDISLKGKTLTILIPQEEVLRPNTTYTINFGAAIKDFHRGNPAKDLRFVFSTGDYLDSLKVRGTILDVLTGAPIENASFLMYDKFSDSIPIKEKPYYYAKTDKTGQFLIENVKAGAYKALAIDDLDQNLRWSGGLERIGFLDSAFVVSDTGKNTCRLNLFNDLYKLRLLEKITGRYGVVKLVFNAAPDTIQLARDSQSVQIKSERIEDSLFVWYKTPHAMNWKLLVGKDSVSIKSLEPDDFFKRYRLLFTGDALPGLRKSNKNTPPPPPGLIRPGAIAQHPAKPGLLSFVSPIAHFDTSKWVLVLDSVPTKAYSLRIDSSNSRILSLETSWKPGRSYQLTLYPGAVSDFYGIQNIDTLQRLINVGSAKQMGGLNLNISKLKPGSHYILQVLSGNGQLETAVPFDANASDKRLVFSNLQAAQYNLRLIEDQNRNGRWDSGNYFLHKQAETLTLKKLEPLRANWDMEASLEAGAADNVKPDKGKK